MRQQAPWKPRRLEPASQLNPLRLALAGHTCRLSIWKYRSYSTCHCQARREGIYSAFAPGCRAGRQRVNALQLYTGQGCTLLFLYKSSGLQKLCQQHVVYVFWRHCKAQPRWSRYRRHTSAGLQHGYESWHQFPLCTVSCQETNRDAGQGPLVLCRFLHRRAGLSVVKPGNCVYGRNIGSAIKLVAQLVYCVSHFAK